MARRILRATTGAAGAPLCDTSSAMRSTGIDLSAFDLAVVAVYFVAVLTHGLWVSRGKRDATDYFLAGRALPWYLIGFSLYASNMSGASFVGLTGAAYQYGMAVFNYEWTATLVLIFFAAAMLPVFLRARVFTVPEYLEHRFDARSRRAYALFTILAIMLVDTAGALYAGGIVIALAIPGLTLWQASAALAAVAGAYTIFGGLRAVVVTDSVQAVLMIFGAAAILAVGLEAVGGWGALMERLGPAHTALMRPPDDMLLPWPGILGVVLLGFYYWTLNQYFVQRALAARSLDQGRKGALFGGLLKLPNLFLMIVPGMIAVVLFPGLGNPDLVFPTLAFELLPVGLRGLVLTALVAAVMSSLDSAITAVASIVTMDFVRPARPAMSGRALLWVGRAVAAAAMIAAAAYAPLIAEFGSLFRYFQATLAYLVPPVVAVYLLGLFWPRATAAGAFWGLVTGVAAGLPLYLLTEVTGLWQAAGLPSLHFTYAAVLIFAVAAAIAVCVSLAQGGAGAAAAELSLRRSDLAPENAAPRGRGGDYRLHAGALAGLMIGLIVLAW